MVLRYILEVSGVKSLMLSLHKMLKNDFYQKLPRRKKNLNIKITYIFKDI